MPPLISNMLEGRDLWLEKAVAMHKSSMEEQSWIAPWVPINPVEFSSAWIACHSLDEALRLDKIIDDGLLYSGNLRLAEGGLAWIP